MQDWIQFTTEKAAPLAPRYIEDMVHQKGALKNSKSSITTFVSITVIELGTRKLGNS
jgi:hypothetical protein